MNRERRNQIEAAISEMGDIISDLDSLVNNDFESRLDTAAE